MTMLVRGQIQHGELQLDEPLDLPDDTEVRLAVLVEEPDALDEAERARLHEVLRSSQAEIERGEVVAMEELLEELRGGAGG